MPPTNPISIPAGYAPAFAVGFSEANGELAIVDDTRPLPVSLAGGDPVEVQAIIPQAPPPLAGTAAANALAGPFVPVPGRAVVLTLSGTWDGSVQVERSVDGGATRHPLTAGGLRWGRYTANACEAVWQEAEDGAQIWLSITLGSGVLAYRVSQ